MKKYIYIIVGIGLLYFSQNMGWLIEGQEAIVATQQVKTGDEYLIGRTSMVFWQNVKTGILLLGGFLTGLGIFGIINSILKNKNKNKI